MAIVDISGNNVGNRGFRNICEVLPFNATLRSLNVAKNQIDGTGIASFCKVIEKHENIVTVERLVLSNNALGNNAVE